MTGLVRFVSWNLLDYGKPGEDPARIERVHQVIRGERDAARAAGDALVLAVQELIADGEDKERLAGNRLQELAEATGLECRHAPDRPAVAVGNHRFHTGLLWTDTVVPAGGWGAYSGANVWHSIAKLSFDVGAGRPVAHASYHAPPFGRHRREDEAERVLAVMTRPGGPGLVGGDWNAVSADRVLRPGWDSDDDSVPDSWTYYDGDPYVRVEWFDDLVYQVRWRRPENALESRGRTVGVIESWKADRGAGEILYSGGLCDVAAELDAEPWTATTGHWPGDPYPPRRIDAIRATRDLEAALTGYYVVAGARDASDHLPVAAVYDPQLVARGAGDSGAS